MKQNAFFGSWVRRKGKKSVKKWNLFNFVSVSEERRAKFVVTTGSDVLARVDSSGDFGSNNVFNALLKIYFSKSSAHQIQSRAYVGNQERFLVPPATVRSTMYVNLLSCCSNPFLHLFKRSFRFDPVKVLLWIWKIYEHACERESSGVKGVHNDVGSNDRSHVCLIFSWKFHNQRAHIGAKKTKYWGTNSSHICGIVYFCMLSVASWG